MPYLPLICVTQFPWSSFTHHSANGSPLLSPGTGDQDAAPWEALEVHVQGARPGDPPDQLHAAALLLRHPPAASQRHRVSVGSPGVPWQLSLPISHRAPPNEGAGTFQALVASHQDVPFLQAPVGDHALSLGWEGR